MDKDRIKGSAQQAKGKVKEVVGKVTGDAKLEGRARPTRRAAKSATPSAASRIPFAASSHAKPRRPDCWWARG